LLQNNKILNIKKPGKFYYCNKLDISSNINFAMLHSEVHLNHYHSIDPIDASLCIPEKKTQPVLPSYFLKKAV